ncbi:MAG: virulence RhuM family protein [Treponema sp.]|nr:virulence RhuM family protein [Treponema sp.]
MTTSSTCSNLAQVADNGKAYNYKFYGLKAVVAVEYKVNSQAAVEFRQ